MTDKKPIFLRGVDPALWLKFRALWMARGKSLGQRITELVTADIATIEKEGTKK
jgi:hypothetical protein